MSNSSSFSLFQGSIGLGFVYELIVDGKKVHFYGIAFTLCKFIYLQGFWNNEKKKSMVVSFTLKSGELCNVRMEKSFLAIWQFYFLT